VSPQQTASGTGPGADALVLVVCTGNICRSPAAERLLAAGLPPRGVVIGSAGTRALVGHPIEPTMAALLDAASVASGGFAARRLTAALVAQADLVLALTAEHRSAVLELHPGALRRSFTLREFAAFATALEPKLGDLDGGAAHDDDAQRLRALVQAADALRRERRLRLPPELDIADPYRLGDAAYAQAYAAILAAVAPIVNALGGNPPQTGQRHPS